MITIGMNLHLMRKAVPKTKNKIVSRVFLKTKRVVNDASEKNFEAAKNYVVLYMQLTSEPQEDRLEIRNLLNKKFRELYPKLNGNS